MRGKLRPKLDRIPKDWHDVIMTICITGLSEQVVTAMTPLQRKQAKRAAVPSLEREERVRLWSEWQNSPDRHGSLNWRDYLESIGRLDLWRDVTAPASLDTGQ